MTTTGKTNRKKSPPPLAGVDLGAASGGMIIIYSRTLEPMSGETSWEWEVLVPR
jgi:hypothetical protein